MLLASLLFAGCSAAAHADQVAGPQPIARTAIAVAPAKIRAPYDVQVIREDGTQLPTHALRDRFYVQGNDGERYTIRITNPTARRVEAVVSVDGLDVIDGEAGDLRKRGYIVPPYGETRIEGFRTSTTDVATFRFSSVDNSYAGQKGKARNVGVIAVAIFEEQPSAQIIAPEPAPHPYPYDRGGDYDYTDDLEDSSAPRVGGAGRAPARDSVGPSRPSVAQKRAPGPTGGSVSIRPTTPSPAPPPPPQPRHEVDGEYYEPPTVTRKTERPGLGTEFGETRHSAATFTKFVRAAHRPVAIAELRYNDASGLIALGIPLQPLPDTRELDTRETADPFPGDDRFARPPGR